MPVYDNMFVALGAWRNMGDLMDREPERNTKRFGDLMDRWDALEKAINDNLPSGSGFDSGCEIVSHTDTTVCTMGGLPIALPLLPPSMAPVSMSRSEATTRLPGNTPTIICVTMWRRLCRKPFLAGLCAPESWD